MKTIVKGFKMQTGIVPVVILDDEEYKADDMLEVSIKKIETSEHVRNMRAIFPKIDDDDLITIVENMKNVKDKSKLVEVFGIPVVGEKKE